MKMDANDYIWNYTSTRKHLGFSQNTSLCYFAIESFNGSESVEFSYRFDWNLYFDFVIAQSSMQSQWWKMRINARCAATIEHDFDTISHAVRWMKD